jgi:hypothetical protein
MEIILLVALVLAAAAFVADRIAYQRLYKKLLEMRMSLGYKEEAKRVKTLKQGYVFLPPDPYDEMRQEHIEKNRREGKDTPISELM